MMGTTTSHEAELSADKLDRSEKPDKQKQCEKTISQEEFLRVFEPHLGSLGVSIWKAISSTSTLMPLQDYNRLIERLSTSKDDGLSFLMNLLNEKITAEDVVSIISWSSFGHSLSNSLINSMLKPLQTVLNSESSVKEDLSRRMKTTYPELGCDLLRIVQHWLAGELVDCSLTFLPAGGQLTDLLRWEVFWLLSCILSAPYKRMGSTRLPRGPPLEIEQLEHLTCLYNSAVDGFSCTRIQEMAFDYNGPLIMLFSSHECLFCLATGDGLRDSVKPYGDENTILFRILPDFAKLVSGRLSSSTSKNEMRGVIHSNFTAKMVKRGLLVGHQPLASPALAINDDFTEFSFAGGPPSKLVAVEAWAAGSTEQLASLKSYKKWELKEVNKAKNRKIKLDSQWQDSADRNLLQLAGINVHHSQSLHPAEEQY